MLWKSDLGVKIIQKSEKAKASAGGSEREQLATEQQPDGTLWEKLKTGHPALRDLMEHPKTMHIKAVPKHLT